MVCLGSEVGGLLDRLDHRANLERLFEERVKSSSREPLGLPVSELARHRDELGHLHGFA